MFNHTGRFLGHESSGPAPPMFLSSYPLSPLPATVVIRPVVASTLRTRWFIVSEM